ncbi:MAG: arginine deiminase-related protein [Bacteroidota bacterium]
MDSERLKLNIANETGKLRAVVLGIANDPGAVPSWEEAYDPKSREHILAGTYPKEEDMVKEMDAFAQVLHKYGVEVFRPKNIPGCNQIFTRDIAFVVGSTLIRSNILPDREEEIQAIQYVLDKIGPASIVEVPEEVHVEGGDVMPWGEYVFVGTYTAPDYPSYITARTNKEAVEFLTDLFPSKTVKAFELRKSNTDAKENALHLDCCFQPVGKDMAILHKNGFLNEADYEWLVDFFGKENVCEIDKEEMYHMYSNVFSISPNVLVSEQNFTRLNCWLKDRGFIVEGIPYAEIAKQEGLLRCSTLPLVRE